MNRESKRHQAPEGSTMTEAPSAGRTSPAQFLREVRRELRKVAWPGRQEVVSYTIVVLVVTVVLTTLVWGLDWVISQAVLNFFE